MICPILASGWLSNKYASRGESTFNIDNFPKCKEVECACWDEDKKKCGFTLPSIAEALLILASKK